MTHVAARRAPLVAFIIVATGCGDATPEMVRADAVEHGRMLFEGHGASAGVDQLPASRGNDYACADCHADSRSSEAASNIVRAGHHFSNVTLRDAYWGGSERDLLRSIDHCLFYFMGSTARLERDDPRARALYAYLDSLRDAGEPEAALPFSVIAKVEDLPAGNAGRGEAAYSRACGHCHGPAFVGLGRAVGAAPILPSETLADHPLGDYEPLERRLVFIEKVRHGVFFGYGGTMPPFSRAKLSDAELSDVLTYLGLDLGSPALEGP